MSYKQYLNSYLKESSIDMQKIKKIYDSINAYKK
jgi:hypothetical protein